MHDLCHQQYKVKGPLLSELDNSKQASLMKDWHTGGTQSMLGGFFVLFLVSGFEFRILGLRDSPKP